MQQLLQITTTPAKYELDITNAKLDYNQNFIPKVEASTTPGKFKIKTSPTTLRLDTYEARHSVGFAKIDDIIRDNAEKGKENVSRYISKTVQMGKNLGSIEKGTTISSLMKQRVLEQPTSITVFIPSNGADVSWQPGSIKTEYDVGSVKNDWQITPYSTNYTPGSVKLRLIQKPSVDIEYVGSPQYVPPSADPNHDDSSVK